MSSSESTRREQAPIANRSAVMAALRPVAIAVPLVALAAVLTYAMSAWQSHLQPLLTAHLMLEAFVLVVCGMVFGIAWHAREQRCADAALAAAFAAAGLLSFWHVATYAGMSPAQHNESIVFAHVARILAAAGIAVVTSPLGPKRVPLATARAMFAAAMLFTVALVAWGVGSPAALPRMYTAAGDPTTARRALAAVAMALYAVAAWGALRRRKESSTYVPLLAASVVALGGEVWFIVDAPWASWQWLVGHACKAVAFYLVYRSLFVQPLHEPALQLDALQARLNDVQAQWQMALDAGAHGLFDWDLASGQMHRSDRYLKMLGYAPGDDPGQTAPWLDLVHPDDAAAVQSLAQQARRSDFREADFEYRMQARDGSYRWLLARAWALSRDADGRPLRIVGIVTDITERKRMEEELRDVTQRLRALAAREREIVEEDRKRIARALHDDFGQYLMALRIELELLAGQQRPAEQRADSVTRELAIVEHLRDAMRRAVRDLRPAVLDDLGVAAAAEALVTDFARVRGVQAHVSTEGTFDDLPRPVGEALYRVLQEALNNIARHAGAREVHVRLERHRDRVTMTVHDDGVGLSADARRKPGHFGLFGIEERVAHLQGHMDLRSSPKAGTTLLVALPLEQG